MIKIINNIYKEKCQNCPKCSGLSLEGLLYLEEMDYENTLRKL